MKLRGEKNRSVKELGIIAVAGSGQDVVSNDVANGTPSEDVDDVEANWVVGFEEANVLLGPSVAGLEVREAVLLRHLLRHVLPLEVEEDEPPQEEGEPCAEAYHQRWVERLCLHNAPFGGGGSERAQLGCGQLQLGEGPEALEGYVGWSDHVAQTTPLDAG